MLETYLTLLELDYFEAAEAFKGLKDENVWKRPAEGLLSVGELAGHVAYWQAVKFASEAKAEGERYPDPAKCKISSPLIDSRFAYYPGTIDTQPSEQHLAMTADDVGKELQRVHQESTKYLRELNPDLTTPPPGWPPFWSYTEILKYAIFHAAYHTGQMYSARHLLGEETVDN